MTTFEIVRDIILLGLALFGAGLSIFNYLQAEKREKRSLRVTMNTAMPAYFDGTIGSPHAKIEATNTGHRPVSITGMYIMLPGGGRMVSLDANSFPDVPDTNLPLILNDGQTAHKHYGYLDIVAALRNSGRTGNVDLTPVAEDSSGGLHKGEPWSITADELEQVGGPIQQ